MFNCFLLTVCLCRTRRTSALWVLAVAALLLLGSASSEEARSKERYAAILVDNISGQILAAENADAYRHPASLVKIMTLYMLFEELELGTLTLQSKLKVSAAASRQPPSKAGLKTGQSILVADAIKLLVTKSANDVAVVVAENIAGSEAAFAMLMTQKAVDLGMRRTTFRNASGLPDPKQVTTARDLAVLSRRIIKDYPRYFGFFALEFFTYRGKRHRNHNGLLFSYEGTDGIKTGYIRASGFNIAVSARQGKKHLLAIVMGGKSPKERNAKATALLDYGFPRAVETRPVKTNPQYRRTEDVRPVFGSQDGP
jgi:D-alanyl-D-alanine carboxypeptidase